MKITKYKQNRETKRLLEDRSMHNNEEEEKWVDEDEYEQHTKIRYDDNPTNDKTIRDEGVDEWCMRIWISRLKKWKGRK